MHRNTARTEQFCETILNILMIQVAAQSHGQAFARVLLDHSQNPKGPSILGSFQHEVITRNMPGKLGPQLQAGAVVQPCSTMFGLSGGHFQPPRCHKRSARLWFTVQPSACNMAVIRDGNNSDHTG